MSTGPFNEMPHGNGGLIQISSKEELIRQRLEDERRRLEKEAGLERKATQQFHKPIENPFTKSQRDRTTILFGGLTWKHEKLIHGALESLGYKCEAMPVPNKKAFQLGKEYGNNGQCNPTYFTVGNLVEFVQALEEKGMSKQEIIDRYVFIHGRRLRALPLRDVRGRVPAGAAQCGLRRVPRAALPAERAG